MADGLSATKQSAASASSSSAVMHRDSEPLLSEKGQTTITDAVVTNVARMAAREVPGVYELGGSTARAAIGDPSSCDCAARSARKLPTNDRKDVAMSIDTIDRETSIASTLMDRDDRNLATIDADEPSPSHRNARAEQLRPGELSMRSRRDGPVHTISLAGELDLASADTVEAELISVEATDATTILLDLSGLTFMDSTAIRLLIVADARSRSNGQRLALRRPPEHVQRVLRICAIADRLPFTDHP